MKNFFACFILSLLCFSVSAQVVKSQPLKERKACPSGDTIKPQFPGGPAEMKKFIDKNMRWPSLSDDVEGTVYMRFTVEADGSITHIEVAKGIPTHAGFDQEAMRLVSVMPEWTPGKIKDQPVAMEVTIPIRFVVN